ncbi:hypothetical protein [Micromonospora sp. MH99]|uniref:hypothetical protein n=1 Tax=Micromonospora sp. MH99 TaxID=1945510 RepID=UPI001F33A830|nr:hypothetical protein [Micromonospora sp. MH99]
MAPSASLLVALTGLPEGGGRSGTSVRSSPASASACAGRWARSHRPASAVSRASRSADTSSSRGVDGRW